MAIRIAIPDDYPHVALKSDDWQRLHVEYAKQFGVETPRRSE